MEGQFDSHLRRRLLNYLPSLVSLFLGLLVVSHGAGNTKITKGCELEILIGSVVLACLIIHVAFQRSFKFGVPFLLMALPVAFVGMFHGYFYGGLLFLALLGLGLANYKPPFKGLGIAYYLLFAVLICLVTLGVTWTGETDFIRNQNFPSTLFNVTVLSSPNRFAALLMLIGVFCTYSYLSSKISVIVYISFFILLLTVIALVCQSRLATLGILTQVPVVFFAKTSRLQATLRVCLTVILSVLLILLSFQINPRFDNVHRVYDDVTLPSGGHGLSDAGRRARVLLATYYAIIESPITGYGAYGARDKFKELGAVYSTENGEKTLSVHGTWAKVALNGGLIALAFYMLSIFMFLHVFFVARKESPATAYSGMSLIISGCVVQLGGDFYLKVMFIVALGVLLSKLSRDPLTLNSVNTDEAVTYSQSNGLQKNG